MAIIEEMDGDWLYTLLGSAMDTTPFEPVSNDAAPYEAEEVDNGRASKRRRIPLRKVRYLEHQLGDGDPLATTLSDRSFLLHKRKAQQLVKKNIVYIVEFPVQAYNGLYILLRNSTPDITFRKINKRSLDNYVIYLDNTIKPAVWKLGHVGNTQYTIAHCVHSIDKLMGPKPCVPIPPEKGWHLNNKDEASILLQPQPTFRPLITHKKHKATKAHNDRIVLHFGYVNNWITDSDIIREFNKCNTMNQPEGMGLPIAEIFTTSEGVTKLKLFDIDEVQKFSELDKSNRTHNQENKAYRKLDSSLAKIKACPRRDLDTARKQFKAHMSLVENFLRLEPTDAITVCLRFKLKKEDNVLDKTLTVDKGHLNMLSTFSDQEIESMEQLIASKCKIHKLYGLERFQTLTYLDVGCNVLRSIPVEIFQIPHLKKLMVGENGISTIPSEIKFAVNLISLDLRSNLLTDLPEEIGELKSLQTLDLSDNDLTVLPSSIKKLKCLTSLKLYSNTKLVVPPEMWEISNLTYLCMRFCGLDNISEDIGRLQKLEYFNVINNRLTRLPESLYTLPKLHDLRVSQNWILKMKPFRMGINVDEDFL